MATWSAIKQDALTAIDTFPITGRFAAEGHGMAGSAYKQLAKSQFEWAVAADKREIWQREHAELARLAKEAKAAESLKDEKVATQTAGETPTEEPPRPETPEETAERLEREREDDLDRCINALETASQRSWSAVEVYLGPSNGTPQRIASLHWVLTQFLSLQAILGKPLPADLWNTAKVSADLERRKKGGTDRIWAIGSLIELYLLQLALPAAERAERQCRSKALAYTDEFLDLDRDPGTFYRYSTSRAIGRYVKYWSKQPFIDALAARGLKRPRKWKSTGGLLGAAEAVMEKLEA